MELTLDELKKENDIVVESRGVKVVYNSDIQMYVHDILIDYSSKWYERGFVLRGAGTSSC